MFSFNKGPTLLHAVFSIHYNFSNYYELLGLRKTCTSTEVRQAYLIQVKLHHPDKNPNKTSLEKFKAIQNAYEILKDDKKRSDYDAFLSSIPKNFYEENPKEHPDFRETYKQYNQKNNNKEKRKKNDYNFHFSQNYYNQKKQYQEQTYSEYDKKVYNEEKIFINKVFIVSFLGFLCVIFIFDQALMRKNAFTNYHLMKKNELNKDPFSYNTVVSNTNTKFENLTGVNFNRKIPSDSEAIRLKLIQTELDSKKIKIEIGSNEIYNPRLRKTKKEIKNKENNLEGRIGQKLGIYKASHKEENSEKGKIISLIDYRERFI